MSLTVRGQTTGAVQRGLTPRDQNALAVLEHHHEQVMGWVAELHDVEQRRAELEARLDDPALQEHPKWAAGESRSCAMYYTIKRLIEQIGWKLDEIPTYWRRLSPAGVDQASVIWGTKNGTSIESLWYATGYTPVPEWAVRRRYLMRFQRNQKGGVA